jgi:hypothetical protein
MCLGATNLHPRLELKLGSREWRQRKGRNALSSQCSFLWRKGPTTLVRNADLAWARVFIGGEMQWSRW